MRRIAILFALVSALAACQHGNAVPAADPAAVSGDGTTREVSINNELYTFEYSYPAEVESIPALNRLINDDLETRRTELEGMAEEARKSAAEDGFPYRQYALWVGWGVVSDLPGWMSLSVSISDYYGGAHPNHGFDALLWDKAAGKQRNTVDLFTSRRALSDALRAEFCRLLDEERAERRGEPPQPGSDDPFDECIDPLESTLILESSGGQGFDRIIVLIAPYAAGPYVEGSYEVTLPLTAQVLALVRPEYRQSFGLSR